MVKVVDDYSKKNWNFLIKNKREVQHHLISLIETLKNKEKKVNYIRCDNAGEHEPLKRYCDEKGINLNDSTKCTTTQWCSRKKS